MRGASQQLGSLGQSASRSTAGVQSAARQWEVSARRGGESAGHAAGDGLSRGVTSGARQAGDRAGGELATGMRGRVRGLGSDIRSELMGPLMAGVAGAGIVSFFQGAIDKASDLNETVSKSKSIFGEQQAAMQQWSQGAAQAMGLSSQKALDAATSFGDMFRQLGDSAPVAAQTSQQVVQLAADLGSFNNLETGDVIDRLSASFRGEFDSLQAIIPNINAARVEQEALTATGKKSASALTQQEKAHATLAIVMRDSSRAQGDFAKTADGAANTAKRNAAAFEDLQAKVGQGLLSAFQALQGAMGGLISGASVLVDGIAKIAHVFSELPGPIQMAIGTFGALRLAQALLGNQITATGARLAALGGAFRTFSAQQTAASVASANLASNMTRSASGMGAMVRVAGGGAVQMGRFGTSIQQVGQHVPAIARAQGAFVNAAAGADRFGRSAGVAAAGGSLLKSAGSGLLGVMGGPLGLAFAGASIAAGVWAKHQQEDAAKVAQHKQQVQELSGVIRQYGSVNNEAGKESIFKGLQESGAVKAAHDLGISVTDLTSAAMGNKPAMDAVNKAIQENGMQARFSGAMAEKAGDGGQVLSESAKKVKGAVDGSNKSIKEGVQGSKDHADAMKANSGAADQAGQSQAQLKQKAEEAAQALKEQVDAYKQLNSVLLQQRSDSRGYQAAIDAATDALKKNGHTLDETTEAGRANGDALDAMAQKAGDFASSQFALHQNTAEANAILVDARKRYVDMAIAMNDTRPRKEIEALANQIIQVRDKAGQPVDLKVSATGVDAVTTKLNKAGKLVATLKGSKVEIPAETPNAPQVLQTLTALGLTAKQLSSDGTKVSIPTEALKAPETRAAIMGIEGATKDAQGNVTIPTSALSADATRNALKQIDNIALQADGRVVIIPSSAPNAPAVKAILEQVSGAAYNADTKSVSIPAESKNAPWVKKLLDQVGTAAYNADTKSVSIPAEALTAQALTDLQNLYNSAHDKTVTIRTVVETVVNPGTSSKAVGVLAHPSARGNVFEGGAVRAFARGGVRENHEPQIARPTPGRVRVWAEPETQGEAYIPFANDGRRGRAKSITEYVARRFGGSVTWHADGSADDWTPDMSGIMQVVSAGRVDPSKVEDARKKWLESNKKFVDAVQKLYRAQSAQAGKTGAALVKAAEQTRKAKEAWAKADDVRWENKRQYDSLASAAKLDTTGRFMQATGQQNGLSQRFLDNIERIKKRGFPRLARSLLEQGDSDAQAIAQTLSGGALSRLKSAQAGLDTSDKLADRKTRLLDDLKGISTGEVADQARAQANAQLIAMQAANQRIAWASGPTTARLEARLDVLADAIRSQPAPIVQPSPVKVITQLDSRPIAESTFGHGARESQWGSVLPGAEGGW